MSIPTHASPLLVITSLELLKPSHDDTTYALKLFSQTLVSFSILKLITSDCPSRCFWPTWALHGVRLPKLRILEHHQWGSDLQLDETDMDTPSSTQWSRTRRPREPVRGLERRVRADPTLRGDARRRAPVLAGLAVYDPDEATATSDGLFYSDIWTQEKMDSDQPGNDVVDAQMEEASFR
ncbi:hypothetical protein FKP32DRAFT_1602193 [Trametes sanguinea]|nr:hypothetical protein FKP32DRAFT_1602193 [Trametes sanguinea]